MKLQKKKINIVTLGCSKNTVDSEALITQLQTSDFDITHDAYDGSAEVVVVNTCGFIGDAKEESINTILDFVQEKENGNIDKLYVMGCLSHRYKEDLQKEIPQVDAYFGSDELPNILSELQLKYQHNLLGERATTTPRHFAYLKISEGCNRKCSFCAIPIMRGQHISRTIDSLVEEAGFLAQKGVVELMLIAQELTYYGIDIYKKRALPELLEALCKVEGIQWIRLHYAYPSKFPFEIFDVMARESKICNYIDIPFQHASDRILKLMKRNTSVQEMQNVIDYGRKLIPNITIRTTMLVGFPGETEDDMNKMIEFVEKNKFDRLGVFQYSHEEDTSAYQMDDNIPSDIKAERATRLMDVQSDISLELNVNKIGRRIDVLIDRKEGDYWVARSEADSPEVDNEILIKTSEKLQQGAFVNVEIINADNFELYGKIIKK